MKRTTKGRHNEQGTSVCELAFGLMIMVVGSLSLFNFGIMYLTEIINDNACRAACRAAANGSPKEWEKRAKVALEHFGAAGFIKDRPSVEKQNSGPQGTPVSVISMQTKLSAKLPAPLLGFPEEFQCHSARQTFPITHVETPTAQDLPN